MLPQTVDTPDIRELIRHNYVLPVGVTNGVVEIDAVPLTNGASLIYSCWVLARDAVVVDDIANTIIEGAGRITAGNLGMITVNRNNKQQVGGVNTFPTDVLWTVTSAINGRLILSANNTGGGTRTGSILLRYWMSRLGLP
jgi:hypothetical protein